MTWDKGSNDNVRAQDLAVQQSEVYLKPLPSLVGTNILLLTLQL